MDGYSLQNPITRAWNIMEWLPHTCLTRPQTKNVFSSEHSVGRIKDGETLASRTTTITRHECSEICCSTPDGEIFLNCHGQYTCSRVSCFEMVSFSIFLIFFMSLLTWNSCSCSKCCSNSAFSCWSWDSKKKRTEENKRRWIKQKRWESRERSKKRLTVSHIKTI